MKEDIKKRAKSNAKGVNFEIVGPNIDDYGTNEQNEQKPDRKPW